MQVEVGEVLTGKVTGITAFGAFVTLPNGKNGLVHISEVANTYVRDVHDYLTEQQEVRVKVIGVNPAGKISLSIKQAAAPAEGQTAQRRAEPRRTERRTAVQSAPADAEGYVPQTSGDRSFEDKLKRFMQESDGKMSGNKLYQQQKRGQRRRK